MSYQSRTRCAVALLATILVSATPLFGDPVVHVDASSACNFSGDCQTCGATWASAFPGLQDAIDCAAVTPGTQVWVRAGTYQPATPQTPISLANGVTVIGGFDTSEATAAESNPSANLTVIDAGGLGRAVHSDGNDSSAVLRGFQITGGYDGGDPLGGGGGGIDLDASSARIVDCTFTGNHGEFAGAAGSIDGGAPEFINCVFHANGHEYLPPPQVGFEHEALAGGAVYLIRGSATFTNCLFYGNSAREGGAITNAYGTLTIQNCTLTANEATRVWGGAIASFSTTFVRNSIIWGNISPQEEPALKFSNLYGELTVEYTNGETLWPGVGNMSVDPVFEDPGGNNYALTYGSPCIDVGLVSLLPPDLGDLDFDGDTVEPLPMDASSSARNAGTELDLGAYELACMADAADCNSNGTPDACEIEFGLSEDCNSNLIPDSCDISGGSSADCNSNGIPDECESLGSTGACCLQDASCVWPVTSCACSSQGGVWHSRKKCFQVMCGMNNNFNAQNSGTTQIP